MISYDELWWLSYDVEFFMILVIFWLLGKIVTTWLSSSKSSYINQTFLKLNIWSRILKLTITFWLNSRISRNLFHKSQRKWDFSVRILILLQYMTIFLHFLGFESFVLTSLGASPPPTKSGSVLGSSLHGLFLETKPWRRPQMIISFELMLKFATYVSLFIATSLAWSEYFPTPTQ